MVDQTTEQLRRLNESDEAARRLFDLMALRSKGRTLEVDRIVRKTSLFREEVVSVFKKLEEVGVGRFILGRRGLASRFEANQALADIASVAKGEVAVLPELTEEDFEGDEETSASMATSRHDRLHFHSFILRSSPLVKVDIPFDITAEEAERLVNFVKSLPIKAV